MITLAQLEAEYSAEVLLEVTSKFGSELQESYELDSAELAAIRTEAEAIITSATSATSTTSTTDGSTEKVEPEVRKSKSKAKAKSLNRQNKAQGAMVQGQREAVQSILKTERESGTKVANLANREFTQSFLETRSGGWQGFGESYAGVTDILLEVADQEYLEESDETEEGDDDPLELAGGFSLQSAVNQGSKA